MDPLLMIHQAPILLEEWTGFLSTEIVPIHRPNSYRVCPENVVPFRKNVMDDCFFSCVSVF